MFICGKDHTFNTSMNASCRMFTLPMDMFPLI